MPVVLVLTQEPSIDQLCWQALSRVGHEVIAVKTVRKPFTPRSRSRCRPPSSMPQPTPKTSRRRGYLLQN